MLSRRLFLAGSAAAVLGLLPPAGPARAEAVLTDDGLYRQPWFLESLLELADDLAGASEKKQALRHHVGAARLPLLQGNASGQFRQARDRELHQGAFRYSAAQHHRLARGRRISTARSCRRSALAEKYGVRFTPTFQFFPDSAAGLAQKKPREREVARAQGYLEPQHVSRRCSGSSPSAPTRRAACATISRRNS